MGGGQGGGNLVKDFGLDHDDPVDHDEDGDHDDDHDYEGGTCSVVRAGRHLLKYNDEVDKILMKLIVMLIIIILIIAIKHDPMMFTGNSF